MRPVWKFHFNQPVFDQRHDMVFNGIVYSFYAQKIRDFLSGSIYAAKFQQAFCPCRGFSFRCRGGLFPKTYSENSLTVLKLRFRHAGQPEFPAHCRYSRVAIFRLMENLHCDNQSGISGVRLYAPKLINPEPSVKPSGTVNFQTVLK